jgi:hypothetical protein
MVTGRVPFMADNSADVMRKHLKEKLIPPDHINTNLSAGVSEVIEIMMAKDRDDRYKDVKELLLDLEALQEGRTPIQAHRKFDVSVLESLEAGEKVQDEDSDYSEEKIAQYRTAILILSAVAAVFLIIIILMFIFRN